MRAEIISIGISEDPSIKSSLEHSGEAGKKAVAAAGIDVEEIDFLLNCGVYRDQNLVEPAMAAIIQKKMGLCLDYVKKPVDRTAFSFDVMDGGCGPIKAMFLANGFLQSQQAKYVAIVTGETHPSMKVFDDFPYKVMGSAFVLKLSTDKEGAGFVDFSFKASKETNLDHRGVLDFNRSGLESRHSIHIDSSPEYIRKLTDFTAENLKSYLADKSIDLDKTALITSQLDSEFAKNLAQEIGCHESHLVESHQDHGSAFTSDFAVGYQKFQQSNLKGSVDQILFVGASAGLNNAFAIYKV